MHRFHLPPGQCSGSKFLLDAHESHHALQVLRLQRGERVVVLDGAGGEYLCEAAQLAKSSVALTVLQRSEHPRLPCEVTLVQAVPKGKTFETIVQKATELGVRRIVPLLSERVVAHLEGEATSAKLQRWRQTAIEAIKQCGSAWLPEIHPPATPRQFLAEPERCELVLIASLQPGARHPRELIEGFYAEHKRPPHSVAVWVGPEGDFTPAELNAARSAGALPITLGRLVLRSETAAVYCLSILNYELQSGRQ